LIKIDAIEPLRAVEMATDDNVKPGERVIVLGYPAISADTYECAKSNEAGKLRDKCDLIPKPTVTDGIISRRGTETKERGVAAYGDMGDAYQMSVVATGEGNSGGPVFNAKGEVIAIFFYERTLGSTRVTFAVPISHGRELLAPPGSR
jgi:serine protease Do